MLKLNDLRIGNYVWEDYGGNYQIHSITPNYIYLIKPFSSVAGRYDIVGVKPIPLTKEWASNFGFKPMKNNNRTWYYNHIFIYFGDKKPPKTNGRILIPYVHNLQNVYWEFKRKELVI